MVVGDRPEHLELLFAGAKIGLVTASVDHRWRQAEIDQAMALYQPRGVVFEAETRALVPALDGPRLCLETDYEPLLAAASDAEALQPVALDAPFTIGTTSGTSGVPKGIQLSHGNMLARMFIYSYDLGFCADDLWLSNTPLAHGGGRAFAMAALIFGGTVLIDDDFDAARTLATIARERVTACFMVPTMFRRLLALPELDATDRASLRCLISSGAPLPPETHAGILERITRNFYQFYSSTESGGITLLPPWFQDTKRDTVGLGVFGKELRIAEDGEILSRGPAVTAGYVANDAATAAAFDGDWYRTGDLGQLDADGFLTVIGRKKEMIISGGLNIYPAEVERVLYAHPAVAEAAIVGVPDPEWGESVCAFVQLRPGTRATETDIIEHCRAQLASYKKPRRVVFLTELPRTSNGKIARSALKA